MSNKVNEFGKTEEEFLKDYDPKDYQNPALTVDILIFTIISDSNDNYRKLPEKSLKLLMIKRRDHPCIGQWALPGGFVSVDESIEDAARRELKEETNIENIYIEQLYTWGELGRDPRTHVVSCSYIALVDSANLNIKAGDDAIEAKWFDVSYVLLDSKNSENKNGYISEKKVLLELKSESECISAIIRIEKSMKDKVTMVNRRLVSSNDIAFDHSIIIEYGIERLRNKIEYTDIAFNLMNECFTLTELQKVYEIILGKELLPAAFRRKIANKVLATHEYTKDYGHRPSRLYKFNKFWNI